MKHFNFLHFPHAPLDCYLLEGNSKTFAKDLQGTAVDDDAGKGKRNDGLRGNCGIYE